MMRTEPRQLQLFMGALAPVGVTAGQPVRSEVAMFTTLFNQPSLRLAAEAEAVALDEVALGIDGLLSAMVGAPHPLQPVDQSGVAAPNQAVPALHSLEPGAIRVVSDIDAESIVPGDGATRVSAPFDEPLAMLVGRSAELQQCPTRLAELPAEVAKRSGWDAVSVPAASTFAPGAEKVDAPIPLNEASVRLTGSGMVASGQKPDADPPHSFVEESWPAGMNALPTVQEQVNPVALENNPFGKNPEGSLAIRVLAGHLPAAATLRPVSTEAERLWLGRLNWQASPFPETGRGPMERGAATAVTEPEDIEAQDRSPRFGMATEPETARLVGSVALAGDPANSSPFAEADQVIMTWTPAGQPAFQGSLAVGPSTAGTLTQLAAGIIATLTQQPDGTTVIVLSPDELGSVRLRLEADARNPDRMIVHLVFDRPETMDLFRRHADQLSDAIRTAGYSEARLDFGQSGTGEDARSRQGPDDRGNAPAMNETDPGTSAINPARHAPNRPADTAGLDLRL